MVKKEILAGVEKVADLANFAYIRQKGPYGNATPILNAEHLIGDEPFIYTFADDFVVAKPQSRFQQMIKIYESTGSNVLTCVRVHNDKDYDRYGIVDGAEETPGLINVFAIMEKPGKINAPSNLASVSGYIFTPEIFGYLREAQNNLQPGSEFIQQPSIQQMIHDGHIFYGLEIKNGKYYDTGNKLEYLKTVVDFGLEHTEFRSAFMAHLKNIVDNEN